MERKPQPSATAGRACCKRARTLSYREMSVCGLSFHANSTRSDFTEKFLSSVWSLSYQRDRLKTCRRRDVHSAPAPISSFLIFLIFRRLFFSFFFFFFWFSGATKEKNQILAVLVFFSPSVADHPSPCWLSNCTLLAWGCMRALLFVCDMTPVCTGQQSHPFLLSLIYSLGTFLLFWSWLVLTWAT